MLCHLQIRRVDLTSLPRDKKVLVVMDNIICPAITATTQKEEINLEEEKESTVNTAFSLAKEDSSTINMDGKQANFQSCSPQQVPAQHVVNISDQGDQTDNVKQKNQALEPVRGSALRSHSSPPHSRSVEHTGTNLIPPPRPPQPPPRQKRVKQKVPNSPAEVHLNPRKSHNGSYSEERPTKVSAPIIRRKRSPYPAFLNPFGDDDDDDEEEEDVIGDKDNDRSIKANEDPKREHEVIKRPPYDEALNPFAGDVDEDVYDEKLNPFEEDLKKEKEKCNPSPTCPSKPKRPPPPVPPRPKAAAKEHCPRKIQKSPHSPSPPVAETSFGQRVKEFFLRREKNESGVKETDKRQKIKWICIEPVESSRPGLLRLKKGQKVVQTRPVNQDLQAYGYIKKGIFKRKIKGYFPITSVQLAEN